MTDFLKKRFGLTDSGIKSVEIASIFSFLVNVGYMSFMMIAMYFGNDVLNGETKSSIHYLVLIVIALIIVIWIVDTEYVKTFNATYREAGELRLELADRIKQLPLSYFSKHDLSDLAQTIMQDVSDIEHAMSHAMPRCIGYILFMVFVSILLLVSNFYLGLATAIPLCIGFSLLYLSRNIQKKWTGKYFWRSRENTEAFQEAIELQREIKSYNLVEENYKKVSKALEESERLRLKTEIAQASPMLLSLTFIKITIGVVSIVASKLLKANVVELIYVIGFLLASIRFIDAMGALEEAFAELIYRCTSKKNQRASVGGHSIWKRP